MDFDVDKLPLEIQANLETEYDDECYELSIADFPKDLQDTLSPKSHVQLTSVISTHKDSIGNWYMTFDGNKRYYNNPQSSLRNRNGEICNNYSLGATVCPYAFLQEIKDETTIPQQLSASNFFVNYVNTKLEQSTKLFIDDLTGNKCKEFGSLTEIDFNGEKHRNIKRFLIDPYFNVFDMPLDETIRAVYYDLYRYFLVVDGGNREKAWVHTCTFFNEEVEPMISSVYTKRFNKGKDLLQSSPYIMYELYGSHDNTDLVSIILDENGKINRGELSKYGEIISRGALEEILLSYNLFHRKKTMAEAKKVVEKNICDAIQEIKKAIKEYQTMPIQEYKVIQEPQYPSGRENWGEDKQFFRLNDPENAEKAGVYQHAFTKEMQDEGIMLWKSKLRGFE